MERPTNLAPPGRDSLPRARPVRAHLGNPRELLGIRRHLCRLSGNPRLCASHSRCTAGPRKPSPVRDHLGFQIASSDARKFNKRNGVDHDLGTALANVFSATYSLPIPGPRGGALVFHGWRVWTLARLLRRATTVIRPSTPGMLDFAVNVRHRQPPDWLVQRLAARLPDLARYPSIDDVHRAQDAVAERHGRARDEVLPLAGAAEGFALLPNLRPELAAVIAPSFTEPAAALTAAGVPVHHVVLEPPFGLDGADGARRRRPGRGRQSDQPHLGAAHPRAAARVAPAGTDPGGRRGVRRFGSRRAGVAGRRRRCPTCWCCAA